MKIRQTIVASAIALAALASTNANAATNVALLTDGASFVSGSSIIAPGTYGLTIDPAIMESNLLTNPPTPPSINNGDHRYIFGTGDSDQSIVIKLGQISHLTSIGADVQVPSYGDRVVSDFSAEVSKDGTSWANFGSALTLTGGSVNPVSVTGAADALYVRYDFGPAISCCGGAGGSAVYQVFASAVPEPATWGLLLLGFFGVGAMVRGSRRQDIIAVA